MTPASQALFGGKRLLVKFADTRRQPEYLVVRELPLRELPALSESLENDAKLVALYIDIPVERTDEIHPDSVAEILAEGDAVNFPRLAVTVARKTARLLRLSAILSEQKGNEPSPATSGATGTTSSPTSP